MVKTLILPGLNGSGDSHWQRIWARECPDCEVVEQENWTCPDLDQWKAALERRLANISDSVHLVAHSLGCILAANLARSTHAQKIRSAFLVAPCDMQVVETLHPCAVHLGEGPDAPLPFPSLVVGSTNDPYITTDNLLRQADIWGSETKVLGSVGHINVASGFGRWQKGYHIFADFNRNLARGLRSPIATSPASPPTGPRVDLLESVVSSGLSAISH